MYAAARSLLFCLDAEASHHLALSALAGYGQLPGAIAPLPGTPRHCFGLDFANPVGLAAGLDKDAAAVEGLARLGFGCVEVGTVTPRPQPGNPRPRLFRLPAQRALINRMGFNNQGVSEMVRRLAALRERGRLGATRLGVNVGKNKDTPLQRAADDYLLCIRAVYPFADYLTLNLSSPNTPGLRTLQSAESLAPLLDAVRNCVAALAGPGQRPVPLLLKIAPDLAEPDLAIIAEAAGRFALDGVIAGNTTISRPGLAGESRAAEAGGLSGAPLRSLALDTVGTLRRLLDPAIPIVGVGGIMDRVSGRAMLEQGASLLQLYTGFIYRGPALIRELASL